MKLLILNLASLALLFTPQASLAQKASSGTDIDGVYEGSIKTNSGNEVPLSVYLHNTHVQVKGDMNELFATKTLLQGNFILDGESDPNTFTVADYQLDKERFDLEYNRIGSFGTAGSVVALRFEGTLQPDGTIAGTVDSGIKSDVNGTFSLHRVSKKATALPSKPKYVGHWKGKIKLNSVAVVPPPKVGATGTPPPPSDLNSDVQSFEVVIDDVGSQSTTNPITIELGTTPGRAAAFSNGGGTPYGSTVYIDYLRKRIWLTAQVSTSAQWAPTQLNLNGFLEDNGDVITGTVSSSIQGEVGQFIVCKGDQVNDKCK